MSDHRYESRAAYRKRMEQRVQRDVQEERQSRDEQYNDRNEYRRGYSGGGTGGGNYNGGNNGGNYGGPGNNNYQHQEPPKKHSTGGRWFRAFIYAIIFLICLGGVWEYHKIHSTAKSVFTNGNGHISRKLQKGDPVSVLMMGTDVGALNRGNKGGNTDTLELMTVNPKNKTITLTSIPRDTLTRVETDEGADYVKINAAYSLGGAKQTVKQVSELIDVPIDYYAVINMGVLKKVVNAVGGVDVNNPFAFTYEGHHFKKGKQHLNGNEALKYSRMRYQDPNNDYGRQKRQQQVIESVIATFRKNGSLSAVNKILDAVKDGVKTNVPIDNIGSLYANYRPAMGNVETYHLQGRNATIDGAAFQIAPPSEINRISRLVRKQLNLQPETVNNNETRMWAYNKRHNKGWQQTGDFRLPHDADYNDPGSGGE